MHMGLYVALMHGVPAPVFGRNLGQWDRLTVWRKGTGIAAIEKNT